MSADAQPSREPSADHQDALAARRAERDETLAAMHELEAALGSAAPEREQTWHRRVLEALEMLEIALAAEYENTLQPDSLLSNIKRNHPRLRSRVHGIRAHYRNLRDSIATLRRDLALDDRTTPDFADIRQRLGWLLTTLRYQRAREADLVYDAYYDTFDVELDHDTPWTEAGSAETPTPEAPLDEAPKRTNTGADRARSLAALQEVERLAGMAARGREDRWLREIRASAASMEAALDIERAEGSEVDSLLTDIERSEPRLHKRVLQVRDRYQQLADEFHELRTLIDKAGDDDLDVADLRRRLDQLATEVRYQRAREADLIYEAYLVDLGSGD
jgi:hypothetical protein